MVLKTIYTNGHHLITELYLCSCNSLFYKNQGGTDFYKSRKERVYFNIVQAHHTFQTAVNRQSGKACPRHGDRFLGPVPDSATLNTFCKKGTIVIYLYWFETMCVRTLCKLQRNKQGWSPYHLLALFLKWDRQ